MLSAKHQVVSGSMYYITLEATDGGKKKRFETKIWEQPWLNFKEVQEFKYVGDAPMSLLARYMTTLHNVLWLALNFQMFTIVHICLEGTISSYY